MSMRNLFFFMANYVKRYRYIVLFSVLLFYPRKLL